MQNHYGLVVWLAAGVYENKIDLCGKYPWRNDVLLGGYEIYLAPPSPHQPSSSFGYLCLLLSHCNYLCMHYEIFVLCVCMFVDKVFLRDLEPEVRERTFVAQFVLKMSLLSRFVAALPRHVHSAAALLGTLCAGCGLPSELL